MARKKRENVPSTGFGGRLKSLREAAGISQQDLAVRAHCSLFTVSKLERGEQEPSWPLALDLAAALGVSVAEFVPAEAHGAVRGEAESREASTAKPRKRGKRADE